MSNAREAFGIKCPEGGKFYICEDDSTPFIGCCANDPCGHNDGTCPDADLRITSFNSSTYEDLPTQDCDNSQGIDNWYVCASSSPPFMGCCSQNACGRDGCPADRLVPAKLSTNDDLRQKFLYPNNGTSTSTAATSSATSTSSSTSSPSDGDSSLSTGATAGIAVGAGVGGMFIIIMVAWLFWWRPRQKKKIAYQKSGMVANQPPDTPGAFPHQQTFAMQSPASSPYDRPQSYAQFSDIGSVTSPSPGLPAYNSVYSTPQPQMMAPVSEMDGTSSAPLEMSTGQEHQISGMNSPQPEKGR
ncbi:hypothetical protein FALBO_15310 [Fusarium albosuccineum]|uniref:Uncharacterized protein n=1 Tax=Fusarium albosuccineum TaxID=1237068 RepID=A0A8H4KWH1_9HYPO|nr:hypothetical protein FALBO_15310 [Fusarium albosuccineum]